MKTQGIWIAEDDTEDLLFYQEIFSELGKTGELVCFTDGKAVIDQLSRYPDQLPYLMILDGHMPLKGGVDVVLDLAANDKLSYVKVAVITDTLSPHERSVTRQYNVPVHPKPTTHSGWKKLVTGLLSADQPSGSQ